MPNATIHKVKAAIIGSGNIGTDLMIKVMRQARHLEMGAMVGVDPQSDGLARAKRLDVATTAEGMDGLLKLDVIPRRSTSSSTPRRRVRTDITTRCCSVTASR